MDCNVKQCPYPGTCPDFGRKGSEAGCQREECPFRIHLRRLVAGEMHRLIQEQNPTPGQQRELQALKREYARLLGPRGGTDCLRKGGEAHGEPTPPQKPARGRTDYRGIPAGV